MDRWHGTVSSSRAPTTITITTRTPECIVETFTNYFREEVVTPQWPSAYFDDDAGVGDGVTREAFTLFWEAARGRSFQSQGGEMAIPTLSPTYNTQFWEIMGRILAYTIAVLGQFPLTCICQVVCRDCLAFSVARMKMSW